jgi:hypothetical protein
MKIAPQRAKNLRFLFSIGFAAASDWNKRVKRARLCHAVSKRFQPLNISEGGLMKIAKLPRVLILIMCTAGLPACFLLRVGGPCYGYGCPTGTAHGDQKMAANAPAQAPTQAPAANAQAQDSSSSDSETQAKSADASHHKHGLLAKLHLTHGD